MAYTLAQLEFLKVHMGVAIPAAFLEKKGEAPSSDPRQAECEGRLAAMEPRVLEAQKTRTGEAQWMPLFMSAQELAGAGKFAEAMAVLNRLDGLLSKPVEPRAQPTQGVVNYAKLLLRWREAQAQAATALTDLGKQLLAVPEVQQDPRFARLQTLVAGLPKLVPTFGEALADQLDAAANGGPQAAENRTAARATIAAYRQQLNAVPVLAALEGFAQRNLGANLPSATALSEALAELDATLAKAS